MHKYLFLLLFSRSMLVVYSQTIAAQKCQEYAKTVYQEADEIFSFRTLIKSKKISTCALYENPLIIGGTPARIKEFPHMAVIGFGSQEDSDMDWFCGGSLISDKHILTAAHCTISQSGPPQMVKLGAVNLKDTENYVQEIIIEKFVNHPEYKRPKKYHDIAILFLRKSATFSAFVRPACLNTVEEIVYPQAKATGYGKTSHDGLDTSQILLKVDLDIIPNSICCKYLRFRKHEMPENLVKQMMCAGDLKEGRDTCQGDSGGPLQVVLNEPYCMYSIIGVISFGQFCGMKYSPGVYTKVDQYVPWIENTIWN